MASPVTSASFASSVVNSATSPSLFVVFRRSRYAAGQRSSPDTHATSAVGVRVVGGVAAGHGLPLPVTALGARREMLRRADVQLVPAVGAFVGAGRDVATGWDRVCHV